MAKRASSRPATRAGHTQSGGEGLTTADRSAPPEGDAHGTEPAAAELTGVANGPIELLADLPLERIAPEPGFNPRQGMDEQELAELASSLALHGLLQPILVRPAPGERAATCSPAATAATPQRSGPG